MSDAIQNQLERRLNRRNEWVDFDLLAHECAALRQMCRHVVDSLYKIHRNKNHEINLSPPWFQKLKAAANGEEVT